MQYFKSIHDLIGGQTQSAQDARMLEFRWLLEELRVSFFAQELAPRSRSASSGFRRLGGS